MSKLPIELIGEILHRLPVKSLKRFRCVARSWCFLIDSENFAKLHLQRSLISRSHHHLIVGGVCAIYSCDLDSPEKASRIKLPFRYRGIEISNSVNGLFLLTVNPLVLWNPFTFEFKFLPHSSFFIKDQSDKNQPPVYSSVFIDYGYGFGYDSRNDDYKIVWYEERTSPPRLLSSETEIYSLKSNSWRKIDNFPYQLRDIVAEKRIHVNGALHTLVEIHALRKIMAFSFENETHYEVMMPKRIKHMSESLNLGVLEGCLCFVCISHQGVEIWVMRDYGVKDSWTKLLSISGVEMKIGSIVEPLMYSRDGAKVLLRFDNSRLVWYDLKKKIVDTVTVYDLNSAFDGELCVESLVSIDQVMKNGPQKKIGSKRMISCQMGSHITSKAKNGDGSGTKSYADHFLL